MVPAAGPDYLWDDGWDGQMTPRLALRILLVILTSPVWLSIWLVVVAVAYVSAILSSLGLFIATGETDWEPLKWANEMATFQFLRKDEPE